MKQLPKIFGIALVMLGYGMHKDFGPADYIAWTIVISTMGIFGGWALSKIIPAKDESDSNGN